MQSMRVLIKHLSLGLILSWSACSLAEVSESEALELALTGAQTALHERDYTTAIRTLERVSGDSSRWEVSFWLGTAFLLDGQLENAAHALDDALSLESGVVDIWVQRAVVAQQRLQPEVALQLLEVASQVDGSYSLTYLNAAVAYESLGDDQNARGAYGRFLKLSTESGDSNRMRRLRRDVLNLIADRSRGG